MVEDYEEVMHATAMSDAFALLELLTQFPTKEAFGTFATGALGEDLRSIAHEAGFEGEALERAICQADDLRRECESGELGYEDIRREYTRLFDHPERPAVYLYEGQFLFDEAGEESSRSAAKQFPERPRTFVNPAALDAEREYKNAGMVRSSDMNVPGDTMFTEMAFMAELFYRRSAALVAKDEVACAAVDAQIEEFKHFHLDKWMDLFYRRCEERSSASLYKMVGAFGQAVYAAL